MTIDYLSNFRVVSSKAYNQKLTTSKKSIFLSFYGTFGEITRFFSKVVGNFNPDINAVLGVLTESVNEFKKDFDTLSAEDKKVALEASKALENIAEEHLKINEIISLKFREIAANIRRTFEVS